MIRNPAIDRTDPSKLEGKRKHIVQAALSAFLERGYDNTSMDQVAARAGVSKQTLYNNFDDKLTLFTAIVNYRCYTLLSSLHEDENATMSVEERLNRLGNQFLSLILSEESLAFYRMLIAVTERNPDLGKLVYECGAGTALNILAERLRKENEKGRMRVDDPHFAAEMLFGMLIGQRHMRRLLGAAGDMPACERERIVKRSVECFLTMYGAQALSWSGARPPCSRA